MIRLSSVIVAGMFISHAFGQNLVLNNSFEDFTGNPVVKKSQLGGNNNCNNQRKLGANQGSTNPWPDFTDWWYGTCGSPDAFGPTHNNQCTSSNAGLGSAGVPGNFHGLESAYSGDHYAGMVVYHGNSSSSAGPEIAEYITGTLSEPLQAGRTYLIGAQVSLSENSDVGFPELGIEFGGSNVYTQTNQPILNPSASPITNSFNCLLSNTWDLASGTYTAIGGETHFRIGYYGDPADTCISQSPLCNPRVFYAYYYVDDVYVEEVSMNSIEGLHDECSLNLRLNPLEERLNVYPSCAMDEAVISLYNMAGELLMQSTLGYSGNFGIDLSGLSHGPYIVNLRNPSISLSQKLVYR